MDRDAVISVRNLVKRYGSRRAVDGLSFSVGRGRIFGLLGANGAGKTTSISCILGLERPDSGQVAVLGMDPRTQRKRIFEQVGVQLQEASVQKEIRVGELCAQMAALYREPEDWRMLLRQFSLEDKVRMKVSALSGGERQKLLVLLALLPRSRVVVLDELTTGLDVRARREVWDVLRGMKRQGLSVLLTSHFMDEVEALCDEICILRRGRTVFLGEPAQCVAGSPYGTMEEAYLWHAEREEEAV